MNAPATNLNLTYRWNALAAHYAYFRGAEYPLSRRVALWNAIRWGFCR